MNMNQLDIIIDTQEKLIKTLSPELLDKWNVLCETADGDLIDGLIALIQFIENN